MGKRKGDWIQTYSGGKFYPLDPHEEDINIVDIAHALSNLCRYTGHSNKFYSVAQHSIIGTVHLLKLYPDNEILAKQFLLHDATEAYINDIARPLKQYLTLYKTIEDNIAKIIYKKFKVSYPFDRVIKIIDNSLLYEESKILMLGTDEWSYDMKEELIPIDIVDMKFLNPGDAETDFLLLYNTLFS